MPMYQPAPIPTGSALPSPQPAASGAAAPAPHDVAPEDRYGQAPAPSAPGGFRARLNYDRDRGRVYIEILDPLTGDVLRTLPPDRAVEEYFALREGGTLLDNLA